MGPILDAQLRVWDAKNFGLVSPGTHRNKFVKKSLVDAGSLFQRGIDLGKKLYLKQSRVVEICLYFFEWLALVFAVAGVRYKSLSMSTVVYYLVEHSKL